MRAVVSRVASAVCRVDDQPVGRIDRGLLIYLGVIAGDTPDEVAVMARKLTQLRIFPDPAGRMNRSVIDIAGGLLVIPNFTLAARTAKGTRPSFTDAAPPEHAESLYEQLLAACRAVVRTEGGVFGGDMRIESVAEGPVTLVLDVPANR